MSGKITADGFKTPTGDGTGYLKDDGTVDKGPKLNFYYEQHTPSSQWSITHNLNKFPSATVIDSAGSTVEGEITYIDKNNLIINFNAGFSGSATLN